MFLSSMSLIGYESTMNSSLTLSLKATQLASLKSKAGPLLPTLLGILGAIFVEHSEALTIGAKIRGGCQNWRGYQN